MTDWQNGDELYASASHKLHRCLYYGMGLRTVGHNVCAPQSWLCQTEGLRLQKLGNTLESLLFPLQLFQSPRISRRYQLPHRKMAQEIHVDGSSVLDSLEALL
eukprot:Filipodium_phascolosomae@DN2414_c0_g1_i6.p1